MLKLLKTLILGEARTGESISPKGIKTTLIPKDFVKAFPTHSANIGRKVIYLQ